MHFESYQQNRRRALNFVYTGSDFTREGKRNLEEVRAAARADAIRPSYLPPTSDIPELLSKSESASVSAGNSARSSHRGRRATPTHSPQSPMSPDDSVSTIVGDSMCCGTSIQQDELSNSNRRRSLSAAPACRRTCTLDRCVMCAHHFPMHFYASSY